MECGFGKQLWLSDHGIIVFDHFLAKSTGIQTIILIPTDVGVVELGSVKSLPEKLRNVADKIEIYMSQAHAILTMHGHLSQAQYKLLNSSSSPMQDKYWNASSSCDLHPCVKLASKYKVVQGQDPYMTIKTKEEKNQMLNGVDNAIFVIKHKSLMEAILKSYSRVLQDFKL